MRNSRRFWSRWQNWIAAILVISFSCVSLAAPLLSPNDPKNPGIFKVVGRATVTEPKPPGTNAPLGTLPGQLSVYHLIVWGTRDAMRFELLVALSTACIGIIYGAVSGYAGGVVNRTMMRVTDAFLTFPIIAGVVLLQQLWLNAVNTTGGTITNMYGGSNLVKSTDSFIQVLLRHVDPLTLSLILLSWMPYARLINTLVIELKHTEYIVAAHAVGARPTRILFRHVLPNAIAPALVFTARDVGGFVILQATLTFIGLTASSPWGIVLAAGRDWVIGPGGNILTYWWTFLPATMVVILFGITWNLFGDGLGELLDPYTRYHR
jgi:peptide/nickel transport system permease protein